jgi:hypothetical protein
MHRRTFLLTLAGTAGAALAACTSVVKVPQPTSTSQPATEVPDLWVIDIDAASPAEQTLAITLQGLVNKQGQRVWTAGDGMNGILLDQLRQEGTAIHTANSAWDLLKQFGGAVKGALLYKLGTDSLNVATSLCGPRQAVAIDESIQDRARAAGLQVLFDARPYDERKAYGEFKDQFAHGVVVEQTEEKNAHLRDYAVQQNAFTYYQMDPGTTTRVVQERGPDTYVFGWGGDEHNWVQTLSKGGGIGIAADWSRNLSALSQMQAPIAPRPRHDPDPVQDGQRIVAFVMSDGDNIQTLAQREAFHLLPVPAMGASQPGQPRRCGAGHRPDAGQATHRPGQLCHHQRACLVVEGDRQADGSGEAHDRSAPARHARCHGGGTGHPVAEQLRYSGGGKMN